MASQQRTYVVYLRAGYYPADSDIAKQAGIAKLPRSFYGKVRAANASDACAKTVAWFNEQMADTRKLNPDITERLVAEPVACTEVVPTYEELLLMTVIADNKAKVASRGRRQLAPRFVDPRAGSIDLFRKYAVIHDNAELCQLEFGDVMIVGNGATGTTLVGVEVKSVWDLISSVETGRLQATQLPGLLRTYDSAALLYYGETRLGRSGELELFRAHGKNRGWSAFKLGQRTVPYGYLEAWLWECAMPGVHVQRVNDERTAAAWLGVLHRWWSKDWSKHKGMRTLDRSREVGLMPGMDSRQLQRCKVASQLPGVGFERAAAAALHFDSVTSMMNASASEWSEVPGVGKVVAKAIVEAVR